MSDLILATLIFIIAVIMSISTIEEKENTLNKVQDTLVTDTLKFKTNYYEND